MYREYKWCRTFPQARAYEDEPARKTDWFLQFERLDEQVQAEQEARRWKAANGR